MAALQDSATIFQGHYRKIKNLLKVCCSFYLNGIQKTNATFWGEMLQREKPGSADLARIYPKKMKKTTGHLVNLLT